MRTEVRFLLAIVLMVGVLVGTNLLFPPVPPEERPDAARDTTAPVPAETVAPAETVQTPEEADPQRAEPDPEPAAAPEIPEAAQAPEESPETLEAGPESEERRVVVESPLYRYTFSTLGARLVSARLLEFESFVADGPVELIPEDGASLGTRLVVGADTLDLRRVPFEVEPAGGLELEPGGEARQLTFTYEHPRTPFRFEIAYTFRPDGYVTTASGRVEGLTGATLYLDLGPGLAFNEHDRDADLQAMAYVGNHLQEGIDATNLRDVEEEDVVRDGPFRWAAFKSKYFVMALLPGSEDDTETYLGGILAQNQEEEEGRVDVTVTHPVAANGTFAFRLFSGPQEFARMANIGEDLQDVNPYGWKFFRPVIRPLVGIVMWMLTFLHDNLGWGYGWVLILFGIMMRVVFFPFYHKAMKAQLRNMAVQPLLKEIQEKHKDNPEKLQKEMMKLYKEHGFNPLAGCLPMLLPWPILITLFFVFQNTIELRGVPFLWLPDLSSPDPLYLLPAILGLSMFLLQFISYRSMEDANPQMKMMMWIMPAVMVFIFLNFASGLNLYYATANLATLPQQIWIAGERKRAKKHGPPTTSD